MTIKMFIQSHGITGINATVIKEYGHQQVDVFLNEIQKKINSGININKPIKRLYDEIKAAPELTIEVQPQTPVQPDQPDPIVQQLVDIPFEWLRYYVDRRNYERFSQRLQRERLIKSLADLYQRTPTDKRTGTNHTLISWQGVLKENFEQIIDDWNEYSTTFDLPQDFDENDSPVTSVIKAIKELIAFLGKRKDEQIYRERKGFKGDMEQTYHILDKFYNEKESLKEIGLELGYADNRPGERPRQIIQGVIEPFLSGMTICHNLRLNRELLEIINGINKSCLYRNENTCHQFIGGADDDQIKDIIKCDFVEIVEGIRFVVPEGKTGIYARVAKHLLNSLQYSVAFVDMDTIKSSVDEKYEIEDFDDDYEIEFIENVLSCDEIVEKQVDPEDNVSTYRIKVEHLATKEQKMARLIHDYGPITTASAVAKYKELFNEEPSVNFSGLKRYEIYNNRKTWSYGKSDKLASYQTIIKEFVNEKIEFHYNDVINRLVDNGYVANDLNEKSIRTAITGLCRVDVKDTNHFCHKEYLEDYPETTWRNPNRDGVTNWILNCIKEALEGKNGIDKEKLIDIIRAKAAGTDFEHKIQQRTKSAIDMFSGPGQPFVLQDNILSRNDAVFGATDFDIIGLRGGKYPFYIQIRSIIANEIKKVESGRMLFTDAIKIINDNLDEKQDRNTIERAINNKHLPPINVKWESVNGSVYLVRSKDIATEPNYELKPSETADEFTVQVIKERDEKRSTITSRIKVNWAELGDKLKSELKFYSKWMQYENIDDLGDAVDGFLSFIKNSENSNLSQRLPQNLYEYHFAQTDHYDRSAYLSNLCIFYEGLLADLYYKRNGKKYRGSGLMDLALQFPWLDKNIRFMNTFRLSKGFERVFNDLYHKRNNYAHGASVDLSSAETALKISDYTAFYIFTVAKLG